MALYFGDQSVSLTSVSGGGSLLELSSVKYFGAIGNGTTDDTDAFLVALQTKKSVYVPEGTYLLSSELIIDSGHELELAVGAILKFTQTSGNCISMRHSAIIRGHHGTITVPYEFNGNVINIISSIDSVANDVSPWTKWDPQWKTARYITDLNITKADSRGFHYSVDGTCYGTAIYCECNLSNGVNTFIWGINFSGIRIAGGFNYGIYLKNLDSAWNHDGRIEVVTDACKIGVCLDNCNNQFISAIIQPRRAMDTSGNYSVYAEYGILLKNSRNTDLTGSRVWDWNTENTKWTNGGQYQHIGMIGNCSGTILNDFLYYEDTSHDIRSLIYTDTVDNLEKLTILQEPFTRWFKLVEGVPYCSDGKISKQLCLQSDLASKFETDSVPNFTNIVSSALDKNGSIFNATGYIKAGGYFSNAGEYVVNNDYGTTGLMACSDNDVIRIEGVKWNTNDNTASRIVMYDSSMAKLQFVNRSIAIQGNSYFVGYTETDNGFILTPKNAGTKYISIGWSARDVLADNIIITKNEEITYKQAGFLNDGINIKASNIIGLEELVRQIIASS